jgi:hypothetical protein
VTDVYGRALAQRLSQIWGQPVVVDNKPGGGTVIGTQLVSRASADGYTLLLTSYGYTSNPVLKKSLPYDVKALSPLYLLGTSANMLTSAAVVQAHCNRVGIDADVEVSEPGNTFHLRRRPPRSTKVSLIIPTCGSSGIVWGQERVFIIEFVQSIVEKSSWNNLEFVVVADTSTPSVVRRALEQLCGDRLVWVDYDKPFNFADKIGQGRAASSGDVLLLLNDDMETISEDFIEELVGLALEPGVGAVGARLLLADGRIQHIGHRYANGTFHLFAGYDGDYAGPEDMCRVTRECIGVTAACLAVRTETFDAVGGMALDFPNNFNDVAGNTHEIHIAMMAYVVDIHRLLLPFIFSHQKRVMGQFVP